ncbi:MAG: hypothetical protein HZA90_09430 [Verrucomicrobia bacterium]|nr:hypothetical protein [Verrucomicrobiota bacterium]
MKTETISLLIEPLKKGVAPVTLTFDVLPEVAAQFNGLASGRAATAQAFSACSAAGGFTETLWNRTLRSNLG